MPARILVVVDVDANVRLLEAKLMVEYFDVVSARNGQEALERIEDSRPDIVLLDVMMPGMDGFEVCRRIRSDGKTMHLPVVMITALSEPADRVRGLEAGADDFLTKPVDDVSLFARVKSLVRLKMMMDELRLRRETSEQFGVNDGGPTMVEEDASSARILVVDDSRLSIQRMETMLGEDGHELVVRSNTDEALNEAQVGDYSLIIVSTLLREGDPLRLCSQLRSHEESRNVPVLILVDADDKSRLIKGLDLGVNDYLTHPIDRNELLARSRTQIRRKRYQERLRDSYRRSISLALTDPLTGVYNRRYLNTHLESLLTGAESRDKVTSILLLDIDHFKQVNDQYGHQAGDAVLKEVALRIEDRLRSFDTIARYGGEEFVVVMPETDSNLAAGVAERLRVMIADTPMAFEDRKIAVTISLGLASARAGETADSVIGRADQALYGAKNSGRNRVVVAEENPTEPVSRVAAG